MITTLLTTLSTAKQGTCGGEQGIDYGCFSRILPPRSNEEMHFTRFGTERSKVQILSPRLLIATVCGHLRMPVCCLRILSRTHSRSKSQAIILPACNPLPKKSLARHNQSAKRNWSVSLRRTLISHCGKLKKRWKFEAGSSRPNPCFGLLLAVDSRRGHRLLCAEAASNRFLIQKRKSHVRCRRFRQTCCRVRAKSCCRW